MKFPVVPESAVAFVISLWLLWVDAFSVIWNFSLVSFILANASPLDPQFHPLFLLLPFFVSAWVALVAWPLRRLKHWGGFVVCSPSILPKVSIFNDFIRLNISPSRIPIVSSSVSSESSASLLVISAFVLIFSLIIPSSLSIIVAEIILPRIADLAFEIGLFSVRGRLCCFYLYYLLFQCFGCIGICSWLVCIIGEGLYIFIFNRLHASLYLAYNVCITAISCGLVWFSCIF